MFDSVRSDPSLATALSSLGKAVTLVLVGMGGGNLSVSPPPFSPEAAVTMSMWGSFSELEEVLILARNGQIRFRTSEFELGRSNEAFDPVESGAMVGRAVVAP